jgi:hypothetical protein
MVAILEIHQHKTLQFYEGQSCDYIVYTFVYIVWDQFKYKCSSFWGKLLLNNNFLLWLMCYNLCRSTNHLGFPIQAKMNMYTGPSNLYWRTIGLNDLYKYLTNQLLSASFSFFFVLCTLCCQLLWIVHFWLPLRYIFSNVYSLQSTANNYSCPVCSCSERIFIHFPIALMAVTCLNKWLIWCHGFLLNTK